MSNVEILHLLNGATQAKGVTVIIDVFRAFTLETCLFEKGAKAVYPVCDLNTAYEMKKQHPDWVLIGERDGKICDGFDFGNSPSEIMKHDFTGKSVVHTTSSGTQGLGACVNASVVLTGSLRNAKATVEYIKKLNPENVSLVAMGWCGRYDTEEDVLCAEYMKSLLDEKPLEDIDQLADELRFTEGKKFFDPAQSDVFPQDDFFVCTDVDHSDFAIIVDKENGQMRSRRVDLE